MINITDEQKEQIKSYASKVRVHRNNNRSETDQRRHHSMGKMAEFVYWNWKKDYSLSAPDCTIHDVKHYRADVGKTHIKSTLVRNETNGWLISKEEFLTWTDNDLVAFVLVDCENDCGTILYEMSVEDFRKVELGEPFLEIMKESHHAVNPLAFYMAGVKRIQ